MAKRKRIALINTTDTQKATDDIKKQFNDLGKHIESQSSKISAEFRKMFSSNSADDLKIKLSNLARQQGVADNSTRNLSTQMDVLSRSQKKTADTTNILDGNIKNMLATFGGAYAIKSFLNQMTSVRGEMEAMEKSFEVLTGSKAKSDKLLSSIVPYAAATSYTVNDLSRATQTLLSFNYELDKTPTLLKQIGDIAQGDSNKFQSLSLAFAQMAGTGHLRGQERMQMINAGFNPLAEIARTTGKSMAELDTEMSKGAITVKMVEDAFKSATSEGGKFNGMMEKNAGGIKNLENQMTGAFENMFNNLGKNSEGIIKSYYEAGILVAENYEKIGKILASLITTYGAYRAAVVLASASTKGWTLAEIGRYRALVLVNKAQKLLNATMLKNPYVLVTTMAVGTITAMLALSGATTEAEKAQKRLNEAFKESETNSIRESRNLARLKGELEATTKGTDEYNRVKDKIVKNYGDYYNGLEAEIEKNGLLTETYNKLTEAITKSFGARQYESFLKSEQDNLDEVMSENLGKIQDRLYKDLGDETGAYIYTQIRESIIAGTELSDEVNKALDKAQDKGTVYADARIDAYIRNIKEAQRVSDEFNEKAKVKFGIIEDGKKEIPETPRDIIMLGKTYRDAKEKWVETKKILKEIESDRDKFSLEQYNNAKENAEKAEAVFKSVGGKVDKTNTTDKRIEAKEWLNNKFRELNNEQFSIELDHEQKLLNLREESFEKQFEQNELNHQKSLLAIKEFEAKKAKEQEEFAKQSYIQKKGSDTGFDFSKFDKKELPKELSDEFIQDQAKSMLDVASKELVKANRDVFEKEQELWNKYLENYGTFQQQKLAITNEFEEKIRKAQSEWERKGFEKERDSKLSQVEANSIKSEVDWVTVFGGLGGMFKDTVKDALAKAKEYTKTDQFKNSDQSSQKDIMDAINQMQKTIGGEGISKQFKQLGTYVQQFHDSEKQLLYLKEKERQAIEESVKAQEKYQKAVKEGTEIEAEIAKEASDNARVKVEQASNEVKAQTALVKENQAGVSDSAMSLNNSMQEVTEGLSKLASGGLSNIYSGFIQGSKAVGGAMEKVADKLESVPIIGWIVAIIDIFKDGLSLVVGGILDAVFDAVSGIIGDVLSGDLFVTIGKSIANGIGKIFDAISFGGFSKLTTKISGSNAKETANTISKLTASNEALKVSVDALRDEMRGFNGTKSIDAYREATEAQERYNKNMQSILDAQMRYHSSHKSNSYYWNLDQKSLDDVNQRLGITLNNSWNDFSKLTPTQMNEIRKHLPDVWSEMINQGKYGDRFKSSWNDYADLADKLENLTEDFRESLGQISFDGFRDNFLNALMDMGKGLEDFASDFEGYMQKALLNFAVGDLMDRELRELYDDWTNLMDKNKGDLDKDAIDAFKKRYEDISEKAFNKRESLAEITGYEGKNSSSQNATKKGFMGMSQDTADELNGRFTALNISSEKILTNTDLIVSQQKAYSIQMQERMSVMRDVLTTGVRYLSDIKNHVARLEAIEVAVRDVAKNTKGLV